MPSAGLVETSRSLRFTLSKTCSSQHPARLNPGHHGKGWTEEQNPKAQTVLVSRCNVCPVLAKPVNNLPTAEREWLGSKCQHQQFRCKPKLWITLSSLIREKYAINIHQIQNHLQKHPGNLYLVILKLKHVRNLGKFLLTDYHYWHLIRCR